jgi:Signal transduction histidine kinase
MKHARFFVAAFGLLFLGAMPAVATWLNQDILAGAARGLLAGSLLEMMMLSFAVADRFAQVQRQLVEETEHRRMLEETYSDELELEVRERTGELERANADKDQILDVIGHDLRGPLTGLMRSGATDGGEFAKETTRTGRALLLVIEDLVLWARLRADTHVIQSHPASALVVPAAVLHRTLAEHDGIALEVDVPEDLMVRTDLVLAQTLVRNLLANALKFADTSVVLRARADGADGVRFTVSNDGAPLSEEVAARFAAGEHEPMTATGGLGLRLCREICEALGMKLNAHADGGSGTEFGFTLPAEDKEEERS